MVGWIDGAGGGIGGFAVQLAKHAGAHVTATASPRSAGAVRELGAGAVVGYHPTGSFDAVQLTALPRDPPPRRSRRPQGQGRGGTLSGKPGCVPDVRKPAPEHS